jgi:hypothetical protein
LLESSPQTLARRAKRVILVGPLPEPRSIFNRAQLEHRAPRLRVAATLDQALRTARELVEHDTRPPPSTTTKA